MKEKIKKNKGFIQIPLLIVIIVIIASIVVALGIGYSVIEYHKTSEIINEAEQLTKEEAQRKIEEEKARRVATEAQMEFERQLTQKQISEIQYKRQEAVKKWAEAEKKLRIHQQLAIGHLLQDYYNEIRKLKDLGTNWWLYDYQEEVQEEVNFASYLAKHDIAEVYWPQYEDKYHSYSGSYSYLDANAKLNYAIFSHDTAGVKYSDSDYEKINKILNFVRYFVHYEYDMNDILRAPVETLGFKSGDCDDYSILVSAALAKAGINSAIMFVESEDGTEMHAMVLFQSEEYIPGLYYYQNLTSYGLPSGNWYILEPQFTLEEHQQNPDWFEKWDIVAAALVGKIESSTESKENVLESLWCNGQYWSPCPSGQKFHCPKIGDPFCCVSDLICNDECWSPCPLNQKFICPSAGDPYCE